MKTIEVFDTKQFEPYRALGIDVDKMTKLVVAGKSIVFELYRVKLNTALQAQLFEALVKTSLAVSKG